MTTKDQLAADAYDAGRAAGSWIIDGNTTKETASRILQGYEDGDPEIMDMQPSPLSGEWADDPTPTTLQRDYELSDDELDDACSVYEERFSQGFWDEVIASAKVYAA